MPIIGAKGLADSDGVIFKTIPPGNYRMRVREVKMQETREDSKYPNNPMLRLVLRVAEGEESEGAVLSYFCMLPSEALPADQYQRSVDTLKNLCIACGLDIADDQLDTDDFMGCELVAVVVEDERTDNNTGEKKKFNSINSVIPAN